LRIFGSVCYIHIPDIKRTKLEERADQGIFLGYSEVAKAYRIYNLKTKKVQISRDVRFDEKLLWDWDKQLVEVAKPDHGGGALLDSDDDENVVVTDAEMDVADHVPVRGTRTLQDVYERCSLVVTEPSSSIEARSIDVWRKAMLQELSLIEKNKTWKLADLPNNKKTIGVKWFSEPN